MTDLNEYLSHKRVALHALKARARAPGYQPSRLHARVTAEGRSGVRRIRIRGHQLLSDSPAEFVGYDLGPSSPELVLGGLGSCLTHTYLIQAAAHGLPVDALEAEVTGQVDGRAGQPGHEDIPVYPHDIAYTIHIATTATQEQLDEVHAAVERSCPVLNLIRHPQTVTGRVAWRVAAPDVAAERPAA